MVPTRLRLKRASKMPGTHEITSLCYEMPLRKGVGRGSTRTTLLGFVEE